MEEACDGPMEELSLGDDDRPNLEILMERFIILAEGVERLI